MTELLRTPELVARFYEKADIKTNEECWIWRGATAPHGYGVFNLGQNTYRGAHRVAYQLSIGPIPDGFDLDHLCRRRNCVNPLHLEPVTRKENLNRGAGVGGALWPK